MSATIFRLRVTFSSFLHSVALPTVFRYHLPHLFLQSIFFSLALLPFPLSFVFFSFHLFRFFLTDMVCVLSPVAHCLLVVSELLHYNKLTFIIKIKKMCGCSSSVRECSRICWQPPAQRMLDLIVSE